MAGRPKEEKYRLATLDLPSDDVLLAVGRAFVRAGQVEYLLKIIHSRTSDTPMAEAVKLRGSLGGLLTGFYQQGEKIFAGLLTSAKRDPELASAANQLDQLNELVPTRNKYVHHGLGKNSDGNFSFLQTAEETEEKAMITELNKLTDIVGRLLPEINNAIRHPRNAMTTGERPVLEQLLDAPGAPLANWREIIDAINDEFGRARTENYRASLLSVFKAIMDVVESAIPSEDVGTLTAFQDARRKHYDTFVIQEALVGQNVSIEMLDAITAREIASGRMPPDHELRKLAQIGTAFPHFSHADLLAKIGLQQDDGKSPSLWHRLWDRIKPS
jgi:hypothetical protein